MLGLGAPLGDDAVGLEVVRELARRVLPSGVGVHEVAEPSALVPFFEGAERIVIVDALLAGGEPGRVLRVPVDELARARPLSTHGVSVAEAIELARIVAPGERRVELVGVTIARAEALPGLTLEVARAVPVAADLVAEILR